MFSFKSLICKNGCYGYSVRIIKPLVSKISIVSKKLNKYKLHNELDCIVQLYYLEAGLKIHTYKMISVDHVR